MESRRDQDGAIGVHSVLPPSKPWPQKHCSFKCTSSLSRDALQEVDARRSQDGTGPVRQRGRYLTSYSTYFPSSSLPRMCGPPLLHGGSKQGMMRTSRPTTAMRCSRAIIIVACGEMLRNMSPSLLYERGLPWESPVPFGASEIHHTRAVTTLVRGKVLFAMRFQGNRIRSGPTEMKRSDPTNMGHPDAVIRRHGDLLGASRRLQHEAGRRRGLPIVSDGGLVSVSVT